MMREPTDARTREDLSPEERATQPELPAARADQRQRGGQEEEPSTGPDSSSAASHDSGVDQFPGENEGE